MALEVEEDVAVVGCRERREPDEFGSELVGCVDSTDCGDFEELERRRIVRLLAGLDLEARLADEPVAAVVVEPSTGRSSVGQRRRSW